MVLLKGFMKFFKRMTITSQLVINALLTLIVVVTIFSFSYYKISQITINNNERYTTEITSNIRHNIEQYYQEVKKILVNTGYDTTTQDFLLSNSPYNMYSVSNKLNILAINTMNVKNDIFDIVVIGDSGKYFTASGHYEIVKRISESIPESGNIYISGFERLEELNEPTRMFFLYGIPVFSTYDNDTYAKRIGFASVMVDLKPIFQEMSKISNNTEIKYYLVDKNNNLYSPDDPLKINNNSEISNKILNEMETGPKGKKIIKINGQKSIVMIDDIPEIEGKIVSFVPEKELLLDIVQIRKEILIIFIISFALLSVLFFFIINNITQPVKKLVIFMNSVKSGVIKNLKKKIQLEGYMEITLLAHEFNSMMDEVNNLTKRLLDTSTKLYEAEIEKEKAELAFLRSQINPHFLYNTLEAMKGIALDEGVDKISEITKALALIFRYSVNGSHIVDLSEEIGIVQAYVHIHTIRSSDRLQAIYNISDETMNVKVFKMILQPIVENVIYHGLELKRGKGRLWIDSRIEDNLLIIRIKDDGVGIDAERLTIIKSSLSEPVMMSGGNQRNSNEGRIGLSNVNNRIKLTYGARYGLSIESEKNIGTEVIITLPAREENNV